MRPDPVTMAFILGLQRHATADRSTQPPPPASSPGQGRLRGVAGAMRRQARAAWLLFVSGLEPQADASAETPAPLR